MKKQLWSSKTAFILASIGSAVGLGNVWRFPYLAARHGGGSFIFPYLAFVFLLGIPILLLEYIVGFKIRKTAYATVKQLNEKYAFLSFVPFLLNFLIFSFYIVITGWTLYYLFSSITGVIPHLETFMHSTSPVFYTLLVAVMTFLVMRLNIREGLEKVNGLGIPILFLSMFAMLAFSAVNLNMSAAIDFIISFDPAVAFLPNNLIMSLSQAIFSLGVGYGLMLTYASYSKRDNLPLSALTVALADVFIASMSLIVLLSVIFTNGLDADQGMTMLFEYIPQVLQEFPLSSLFVPLFFLLLFLTAFTSVISINELLISNIKDLTKMERQKSSFYGIILVFIAALPSALSWNKNINIMGMPFLEFLNDFVLSSFAPLAALLFTVLLITSYKKLDSEAKAELPLILAKPFLFIVKYVAPAVLFVIFIAQFC